MVQDVVRGLLKAGCAAVGIPYTVEVLVVCVRSGADYRPALDGTSGFQFAKRLLLWAGVALVATAVKLARPLLNMLTEASADLGYWAITRHAVCGPAGGQER